MTGEKRVSERLVWVDVETTGIESHDIMLEIAVIVTDNDLNELGSFSSLILDCDPRNLRPEDQPRTKDSDIPCFGSHFESGLVMDLIVELGRNGILPTVSLVQDAVVGFLNGHGVYENMDPPPPLCGSSVQFDRSYIAQYMPKMWELLHYRNIDVSTVRELQRRWAKDLLLAAEEEEPQHRALSDLRYSLKLLRNFREKGFIGC